LSRPAHSRSTTSIPPTTRAGRRSRRGFRGGVEHGSLTVPGNS
jgi:hypothetical protein